MLGKAYRGSHYCDTEDGTYGVLINEDKGVYAIYIFDDGMMYQVEFDYLNIDTQTLIGLCLSEEVQDEVWDMVHSDEPDTTECRCLLDCFCTERGSVIEHYDRKVMCKVLSKSPGWGDVK